jgi:glycerate kinase
LETVRALAAPASLKGVLTAVEAAGYLAHGFRESGVDVEELPIEDGGEGTAEVLHRACGGDWRTATISDPLLRPVEARWLMLDGGRAVVESAEAIGLGRVAEEERDPLVASSRGFGELIRAALEARPSSLLVCLGGTATVDGGSGLREVLDELPVPTTVACDVRNPLLGEDGAASAFGPQKGATPEVVRVLEERLAAMPELAPVASVPGAGAAGGLGAAFAVLGGDLVLGAELVLELVDFRAHLDGISLAVTGEGIVDRWSAEEGGKSSGVVARMCREAGVPCVVFGGEIKHHVEGAELYELSGDKDLAEEDLVALGEFLAKRLLGDPGG